MAYILILSVMFGNVTYLTSRPFPTLTECQTQGDIASTYTLKLIGTENGPTAFAYQCVPNRIKRS